MVIYMSCMHILGIRLLKLNLIPHNRGPLYLVQKWLFELQNPNHGPCIKSLKEVPTEFWSVELVLDNSKNTCKNIDPKSFIFRLPGFVKSLGWANVISDLYPTIIDRIKCSNPKNLATVKMLMS